MAAPRLRWTCIAKHANLQRSSHVLSVIGEEAFIFGGELTPREPRDNEVFRVRLHEDGNVELFVRARTNK